MLGGRTMEDIYQMRLGKKFFDLVRDGKKTIELRVNDAKRKKYKVGNVVSFVCLDNPEEVISTQITAMYYFDSIKDAVITLGKQKLGFSETMTIDKIEDEYMQFYSNEEIQKLGLVALVLSLQNE